jgi:UDP-3-O-[3-hydroxymyristoyl] glucosamine N-acyltransferase
MSRENLVLGEGVQIADDAEIGANVVIHAGTVIGAGCVIQDNVVLGKTPKLASRSTAKKNDLPGLVLGEAVMLC